MDKITIEGLEALATALETDTETRRGRLLRLCAAYGRILAAREPERFTRRACHYGDEAGHYDVSFPPELEYSDRTGPASILIADPETEDVATSSGFYYTWRRVTRAPGLAFGRDGRWYRGTAEGTGTLGQFAAHPGDHRVDVTIEWESVAAREIATDELAATEAALRALAFPLLASRTGAQS